MIFLIIALAVWYLIGVFVWVFFIIPRCVSRDEDRLFVAFLILLPLVSLGGPLLFLLPLCEEDL